MVRRVPSGMQTKFAVSFTLLVALTVGLYTMEAVPIDLGTCRGDGLYRVHFAVRLCHWDAEESPDFSCTHRLSTGRGWFADGARACSEGTLLKERWLGYTVDPWSAIW